MAYPVVEEAVLPPVPRDRLRRPRRDSRDLPSPRLGTVYLFKTSAGYVQYAQRHLDHTDPVIVDATEVCLVQLRPQHLVVEVGLRSTEEGELLIHAVFRCRVVDPVAVATAGIGDGDFLLAGHLAADTEIALLVASADLHDLHDFRRRAEARIRAYCAVCPPDIEGLDVALAGVRVDTDSDIAPRSPIVIPDGGRR